jgi:hypothetical protein
MECCESMARFLQTSLSLRHRTLRATAVLVVLAMLLPGCREEQDDSFDLSGQWLVKSYTFERFLDNWQVNDLEGTDGGMFLLNNGGSGTADITVPGLQTSGTRPIGWQHDAGRRKLSIDFQDGRGFKDFELLFNPDNTIRLSRSEMGVFQGESERTIVTLVLARIDDLP